MFFNNLNSKRFYIVNSKLFFFTFFNISFLLICSILVVFRRVVNVYIVRGMSKGQSLQSQEHEQVAF